MSSSAYGHVLSLCLFFVRTVPLKTTKLFLKSSSRRAATTRLLQADVFCDLEGYKVT